MSIKAGLVGLPNVGKSTLFNALTKSSVPAENYPFCTIDPHLAITNVPDERLEILQKLYQSKEIIPASVMFVDIAGLVKGAAAGQGLGNQFLSHIREVDVILHVLRCFENTDIIHTHQKIDPLDDYQVIIQELALKDLESVQKRQLKIEHLLKAARNDPAELKQLTSESHILKELVKELNNVDLKKIKELAAQIPPESIQLLTAKNFLIVANIDEKEIEPNAWHTNLHYQKLIQFFGEQKVIPLCVRLEYELSQLPSEEATELITALGLKEPGLAAVIRRTYQELGLITFFTCGPEETHAWPIHAGITIRQASGEIHSDLERGFICAEVMNCHDVITHGSPVKAKDAGKLRIEGQDYIVTDGDIINVRFNV